MPRAPNAVDFWRGFALVTIYMNHTPGLFFERFTHRNFGYSDAAEVFVFLAGWGLHYAAERRGAVQSTALLLWNLGRRVIKIYAAQILIISIAIAILAVASIALDNPLVITWHNAESVFYDPVRTNIGLVTLTHQLGYFNILPLYVVLTLMALLIAVIDRFAPNAVLPLSFVLYCVVLGFQINLPTWPVEGRWFFNPLAWQFIFVLGFVMAKERGFGLFVRRHIGWIRMVAAPAILVSAVLVWNGVFPDPTKLPEPRLFFADYKTFQTPIRLLHLLALVAVFSAAFPCILSALPRLAGFLALLGRNSLNVFCVGSLLSLSAQVLRFAAGGTMLVDTAILLIGLLAMWLVAWLAEWATTAKRPT